MGQGGALLRLRSEPALNIVEGTASVAVIIDYFFPHIRHTIAIDLPGLPKGGGSDIMPAF